MPEGQTVCDDFDASLVSDRNVEVHVGKLVARTPEVAQAVRWSPRGSSAPWQRHLRGASGRGRRRRRSRRTRNCALGMAMSSRVGMRFSAREAKGPACDSSSARDAGVRSERCVSYARLSQARAAERCQPLTGHGSSAWSGSGGAVAAPEQRSAQAGASKPRSHRCARAWVAAAVEGRAPSPCRAARRRAAAAGALARMTGRVSHQEAQHAAKRSCQAERRPSPPKRWAS